MASLLFVGAYVLGAGTLKDLALALFVGIAVGTYSSIFIATPVLAQLKEREPAMQALAKRVNATSRGRTRDGHGGRGDRPRVAAESATPGIKPSGSPVAWSPQPAAPQAEEQALSLCSVVDWRPCRRYSDDLDRCQHVSERGECEQRDAGSRSTA